MFQSPYGAWVSSLASVRENARINVVSVPLRGMGFIECGIHINAENKVSVPLRGMGFIGEYECIYVQQFSFRPLTGHGFHQDTREKPSKNEKVSVPLRGMGFIGKNAYAYFNIKTHC